jgi:hypothetical protein
MIKSYPLVFAENYYIHYRGYVYRKDKINRVISYYNKSKIVVKINDIEYDLLNLMIEYFARDKVGYKRIKVKKPKNSLLEIPLSNIIFVYDETNITFDSSDNQLIEKYRCNSKAKTANKRDLNQIDKNDILYVLRKYGFKCRYCGKLLEKHNWHLDHISPISLGGLNVVENLACACKSCNLMKHNMPECDFIAKCLRIIKHNNLISNG